MAGRLRAVAALALLTSSIIPFSSTSASETITYSYDARGRLVQVARSGDVNSGVTANYTYDPADNRTQVVVTGAGMTPSSFAIGDVAVAEGGVLNFTVTRSGNLSASQSVTWGSAGNTATSGTDFTAAGGTVTFAVNESTRPVNVTTLQDTAVEGNETLFVNLTAPTGGASISDAQGIGTISDSTVFILYSGQEIRSPDGRFALVMQTDGNLVLYGPDGAMWATATNGGNDRRMVMQGDGNLVVYNGADQPLWHSSTQSPGARLSLQNDGNLVIYSSENAPIWATNTIYQPPSFAISDVSVAEGGALVLTVTKTGTGSGSYTVNYASANGTATAASDYTAVNAVLTFASSDTTKTISIATIDDSAVESSETVLVNLTSPSGGATLIDSQGVGTITDNDVAGPSFSVSDGSATEGSSITFTITRGGSTSGSVNVSYATAHGTAGGLDYTAASGTLTFTAGQTSKTVTVLTKNNQIQEELEEFTLNLSNPTGGATISDGQGIGTIYDDDGEACPSCRG